MSLVLLKVNYRDWWNIKLMNWGAIYPMIKIFAGHLLRHMNYHFYTIGVDDQCEKLMTSSYWFTSLTLDCYYAWCYDMAWDEVWYDDICLKYIDVSSHHKNWEDEKRSTITTFNVKNDVIWYVQILCNKGPTSKK